MGEIIIKNNIYKGSGKISMTWTFVFEETGWAYFNPLTINIQLLSRGFYFIRKKKPSRSEASKFC
jgi:hypothetical protein